MQQKNSNSKSHPEKGKHVNPLADEIHNKERIAAEKAHAEADKDIEQDFDLSVHSPNDDLDEGETARLGEDMKGII
ncbi:MAG TPA: hypothetical protein VM888_08770 [Chitinophagaceae bacterium]|jgi:hypothetical protein|nr:hypothetical protein [Chitinophagaceae bacterium]